MLALIDFDIIRYKVGFACETRYYDVYIKGDEHLGCIFTTTDKKERDAWVIEYVGSLEDVTLQERYIPDKLENCLHSVKFQIEFILSRTGATEYRGFLTGKDNFRDKLVDYYKESRRGKRKPTYYQEIGDYLIEHWNAEVVDGQEADDALSITQYTDFYLQNQKVFRKPIYSTIICTIDKDLDNCPGWHFNFDRDEKYWVTEDEALLGFYLQMLTGDSSDDIPGLYRITGQKCTKKIKEPLFYCDTEVEMWQYVKGAYLKAVETKCKGSFNYSEPQPLVDKLIEIGRLLWIRRTEDEIWQPPTQ
jgi:hypothetical protein